MTASNRRTIRYSLDYWSIATVIAVLAYQLGCTLIAATWLWLLPLVFLSNLVHLVEHNHVHVPIFSKKKYNEVFSWLLCLGTGIPVEGYRFHHAETHHRYSGTSLDWTSPFAYRGARFPDRPVNLAWYAVTYMPRAWRKGLQTMWERRATDQGKKFWRSILVLTITASALGLVQPRSFLLFFGLPWIGNAVVPALTNWRHHRGCDFASKYTAANVNLGLFSRALGFNIGYHSAHHDHPGLHWSLLPECFFREFAASTPPDRILSGRRLLRSQA